MLVLQTGEASASLAGATILAAYAIICTMIHTSFVVLSYNRTPLLRRTLLGYRRYAPYEGTEFVIVDDKSTDGLLELLPLAREIFERVHYVSMDKTKSVVPLNPRCTNPSLGLNVGIRHAIGKLIIMSPPECYPLKDNIHNAQQAMDFGSRRTYLFGRALKAEKILNDVLDTTDWLPDSEEAVRERVPTALTTPIVSEFDRRFHWPFFASFLKSDHAHVNGFDEEFLRGHAAEDDDFAYRMLRGGTSFEWSDQCSVVHQWHPDVGNGATHEDYEVNRLHYFANCEKNVVIANVGREFGSSTVVTNSVVYAR